MKIFWTIFNKTFNNVYLENTLSFNGTKEAGGVTEKSNIVCQGFFQL